MNWEVAPRPIRTNAPVHPTVEQRFRLDEVTQCAGSPEPIAGVAEKPRQAQASLPFSDAGELTPPRRLTCDRVKAN